MMEEIYDEPKQESKKEMIIRLRSEGLSYSQIGEKVGVSKPYISKVLQEAEELTKVNQSLTKKPSTELTKVNQPDTEGKEETLGELKERLNIILREIYTKIADIKKQQDTMQEDFNKRVNKVISFHLDKRLESLREQIIKQVSEVKKD